MTISHYADILNKLKDHSFACILYGEYDPQANQDRLVILRHDLDASIRYAHQIAEVETNKSMKSTYFVWLTSPFYNVMDKESLKLLKDISDMKHDIGLHFDVSAYAGITDVEPAIRREVNILSEMIERPVQTFSFHRPISTLLEADLHIPGFINAYSRTFFKDFKYISDSNHHWREGCVCNHLNNARLHILTHPIWWTWNDTITPEQKVQRFIQDQSVALTRDLCDTVEGYKRVISGDAWA